MIFAMHQKYLPPVVAQPVFSPGIFTSMKTLNMREKHPERNLKLYVYS